MAKKFRYKHISSVIEDRVPQSLLDGEIAVNRFAGKEKLFIKNSEGDIVPFIPEHEITVLSANVKTLAIATAEDINELSATTSELGEDINELSATTSELGEGISANTQNIEILSASTIETESGLNQLSAATEDEIERALSAETFLQEQITEVSENLDTLAIAVNEDVNELSATVKTFIIAATEDIDELSATTEDISTLSGKVEELSAATTGISSDLNTLSASTTGISSNLNTLSGSVQNLSASTTGISSNLNTLSASTTGISSNLNTLSGSVQTLSASTTGISSNLNTLSGKVEELSAATTGISSDLNTLSASTTGISSNLNTLSGSVQTLSASCEQSEYVIAQSLIDLNDRVDEVSGDVSTVSSNISTLSGNVSTISGNVQTLSGNVSTISGNVQTLSGSVVTLSGNVDTLATAVVRDINELSGNVSTLSGSVLTFSGNAQVIINQLLQQIDSLKNYVNYHDYVEIGGVKWATMNIGATAITDTGLYYQWGDISGYTASQVGSGAGQKYFGWADYKWSGNTSAISGMTKYQGTGTGADGLTTLQLSDDAVNAAWGGNWRMPTTAEFAALGAAVNSAWTADYQGTGVAGMICTDKTDSSKVLFFPAAGYCGNGSVRYVGSVGYCWSSSVYSSNVQYAYLLFFNSGDVDWQNGYDDRLYGFPVRGVKIN